MSDRTEGPPAPLALLDRYDGRMAALIAAVALAVRLPGFTAWWLNPDEGIYYSILTRREWGAFWGEVVRNAHPPLYYLILRAVGVLTWDFLWFRGLSLACGVALVWVVWRVARELRGGGAAGTVAGLGAALLVAFAPGTVVLSQVMRPYTLQLLLLAGSLLFLLRYRATRAPGALGWYSATLCGALLTHYSSFLAAGALAAGAVYVELEAKEDRSARVRLLAAHAAPALVAAGLYALHLRGLAAGALADEALGGWLSPYMVSTPREAWLGLVGLTSLLGHAWLRGPLMVLLLLAIGSALRGPDRLPAVLAGAALLIGVAAAAAHLYPLGATRHSAWLVVFLAPVLAHPAGYLVSGSRRTRALAAAVPVALVALGGPVGTALGVERAPWAPTEHVLRRADLVRMIPAIDPEGAPRMVVMSYQTYYLLLPFYPTERESAVESGDGEHFRFDYGDRDVFVTREWDFTGATGAADSASHLAHVLRDLEEAFPDRFAREPASLLVGGWRPPFVDDLLALGEEHPGLLRLRYVPGLFDFTLNLELYLDVVG